MGIALSPALPVKQQEPPAPGSWRRGPKTLPMASAEFLAGGGIFLAVTLTAWRLHLMLPAVAPVYFLGIVLAAIRWGFRKPP